MRRREHRPNPRLAPLVSVRGAGEVWNAAIRDLAGLKVREAASHLQARGLSVHSPTLDLIIHGQQVTARLDLVRETADLCGIPYQWLLAREEGREFEEDGVRLEAYHGAAKEWRTIGLVRSSFTLTCLQAAKRDHLAAGNSKEDWTAPPARLRNRLAGAFRHLVDPEHWRHRLTAGKLLTLAARAAACLELRRSWLSILGPWIRGQESLDYATLRDLATVRKAKRAGPAVFGEGLWVDVWHDEPA